MGFEVFDSDTMKLPVKNGGSSLDENYIGKLNIDEKPNFDSQRRTDGDVKADEDPAMDTNKAKRIHQFYFPKFPIHKDPELELRIKEAEKEVEERNEARLEIKGSIRIKEVDQAEIISQLRTLIDKDKRYSEVLRIKRKGRDVLLEEIARLSLHGTINGSKERGVCLCSSEEELNDLIRSLHYKLQHKSDGLADEMLLHREIKQLEGTRSKVMAIAARREKIRALKGRNEVLQNLFTEEECKAMVGKPALAGKIKFMKEQRKALEGQIRSSKKELAFVNRKRVEAYEGLAELRRQSDEPNARHYYKNRLLLRDARALATKKDIAALEELSYKEVEKFMSQWNTDKAFRDDYLSRILPSLDDRELDRDGLTRDPNVELLVAKLRHSKMKNSPKSMIPNIRVLP